MLGSTGGSDVQQEGAERAATGARLGGIAVLLGASVLLSRVVGYAREAVLAYEVGAGAHMDAYRAAFQLPDMLNYFLAGGALSIAFLPLYARAREERGGPAAERLLATVLGTTGLAALLATAALWWWAPALTALQFGGFDASTQALTTRLTRIVLPAQVFFVCGGIVRAVAMAHGRFVAQAAAPLVYTGAVIAGGLLWPEGGPEGFAWGALVGAVLGPFGLSLLETRRVARVRARVAPGDRELLRYLAVAAPLMLGLSLLTVDEWYERWFGNRVGEGVVAQLGYARQLMLAPVAVVGQAVATAALPTFARLFSQGRRSELARVTLRTLQGSLGLGILAAAGVFVLAPRVVEVLFQRGAFGAEDAQNVSRLLRVLCFAVPGWVLQQVVARAFYARGDTWRPMLLGTGFALVAVPLYLAFGARFGAAGLAAAGAIAMSANAGATLIWARARHGAPALGPLFGTGGRALLAAAPAVALGLVAQRGAPGFGGALLDLVLGGAAFGATAAFAAWWVADEALRAPLLGLARRLLRRAAPGDPPR